MNAAYSSNGSVKLDPTDKKSVRAKYLEAHVVAVEQLDGNIKVIKNRWGWCGVTMPKALYDVKVADLQKANPHLEVNVWYLTWWDAQSLLKGMVNL